MEPVNQEISKNPIGKCPILGETQDNLLSHVNLPERGQGSQRRPPTTYIQTFSGDRQPVREPPPTQVRSTTTDITPPPVELPPPPVQPPTQPPEELPREPPPPSGRLITEPQLERRFIDHQPEFFVDKRAGTAGELSPQETVRKYSNEVKKIDDFLFETVDGKKIPKQWLTDAYPPDEGISADDPKYHDRLVQAVAQRIRFQGDLKAEQLRTGRPDADPLYDQMRRLNMFAEVAQEEKLLMAAEAMHYLYLQAENNSKLEEYQKTREGLLRFSIKPVESSSGAMMDLSGEAPIFNLPNLTPEQKQRYQQELVTYKNFREMATIVNNQVKIAEYDQKIKEVQTSLYGSEQRKKVSAESPFVPDMDLYASALLTDAFMDEPYEKDSGGQPVTMRQKIEQIHQKKEALRAKPSYLKEDFDRLTNDEMVLRKEFYEKAREVLQKRNIASPFNERNNPFQYHALQLLRDLGNSAKNPNMLEALVDRYIVHNRLVPPNNQPETDPRKYLLDKLTKIFNVQPGETGITGFATYAYEGVDFLERKAEIAVAIPELHKIPKAIRGKDFIKVGRYEEVPLDYDVLILKGGRVEIQPPPIVPPKPVPPELPPSPKINPEAKDHPPPGPVKSDEIEPPPVESPPTPPPVILEELAATLDAGAGFIDKERKSQNMLQVADHLFSDDLRPDTKSFWYRARDKALGWSYRIPILGGVIRGMTHPVQMIWQQGLARSIFEQQHIRFAADLNTTLQKIGGTGIPVEMTIEMAQKAVDEGRKLRDSQPFLKRMVWKLSDTSKGILGVSQTAEQIFAKKWLEDELAKPEDQRTEELKMTGSSTIREQTDLGERYAQWDKALTFEQSNKVRVSSEVGETRHQLPQEMQKPVNDRLKGFIADFAGGRLTEKQLIEKINEYLLEDVRTELSRLDPSLAKEFDTNEVGSNILNLARYVKGGNRWQRYQNEKTESGKTKWEELQVSLLVGKAEFGRVRGHKEMGFLAENLARRLSEGGGVSEKLQAGATAYAKDITTNVGAYAAGYWGAALGMSILGIPKNAALKMFGGFAGIAGGAAFKETGIAIPWAKNWEFNKWGHRFTPFMVKGRYLKEVEQLSREAARGRLTPERAKIRKEMETLLVPRLKVQELLEGEGTNVGLESLVYKKENLTADEAKRLFSQLVDIKARMRLTDLSQTRAMDFKTQNYFEFIEGHENQQNARLTAALEQGLTKIIKSGRGDLLGTNFDRFDNLTAVAEAQLRYSTADKRAMRSWLQKNKGLTKQEADNWMTTMLPDIDLQIQKSDSLRSKNRRLTALTIKRGATTFVRAAITGMMTEGMTNFVKDVQHGGFQEAFGELKQIYIDGKPPLELNSQGVLHADLTTGQKLYLGARYWIEPPFPSTGHFVQIDNANLNLPGALSYQEQVINGHTYQAIVDIRTGAIKMDLTGFKLDYKDVNADNHLELVAIDDTSGQVITSGFANGEAYVMDLFHRSGIDLKPDGIRGSVDQPVEIFQPGATVNRGVDLDRNGTDDVTTKIPANTNWQPDPTDSSKWVLHGQNIDGSDRILINHATINSNGQITATDYDHTIIHISNTLPVPGGEPGSTINIEPTSGGEIWGSAADYRVVHAATEPQAINNFVEKTTDPTHPYAVTFLWHDKIIHNPNTGADINVSQANQAGQVGMLLQVPHFGSQGQDVAIFVPAHQAADGGWEVHFDPTDTRTIIQLPDGHSTTTMAELSHAFLNTEKLAEHGTGSLGSELTFEGRAAFNLANPDGLLEHQGRILAGVLDPTSKNYGHNAYEGAFLATHAVHGSGMVGGGLTEGPPIPPPSSMNEINIDPISDTIKIDQLGYRVEAPPFAFTYELNPPVPMRENMEKSVRADSQVSDSSHRRPPLPVNPPQPIVPPQPPVPPTPEEDLRKKKDEEKKESYIRGKEEGIAELSKDLQLVKDNNLNEEEFKEKWLKTPAEAEVNKEETVKNAAIEMMVEQEVFDQVLMSLPAADKEFLRRLEETPEQEEVELSQDDKQRLAQLQIQVGEKAQELLANSDDKREELRAQFDKWEAEEAEQHSTPSTEISEDEKKQTTFLLTQKQKELDQLNQVTRLKKEKNMGNTEIDEEKIRQLIEEITELEAKLTVNKLPPIPPPPLSTPEERTELVIDDETLKKLPAIKSEDLNYVKEVTGSVFKSGTPNAFIVEIGPQQKKAPYEVYDYDEEKKKFKLRKLYPEAPTLTLIALNGSVYEVRAGAGYLLDFDENYFILDNTFYVLFENSVLLAVTDPQKIEELKKKIKKQN